MITAKTYAAGPAAVSNIDLNLIEKRIQDLWNAAGEEPLDTFPGATDKDKMINAMSYCAQQSRPPAIKLGGRGYDFADLKILAYDGFRLRGSGTVSNSEKGDVNMLTQVNSSANGLFIDTGSTDKWNGEISGFAGIGSASTTFLGGAGVWHCGLIRDVSLKGFKTVLGTQSQKLLMTASLIDGWWQMQGFYNGPVHIGGSDNRLFMGSSLSDASQTYNTSGNAAGQFQYWFDGLDNTTIGPLYITATGLWGGIDVSGVAYNQGITGNRAMLTFTPGMTLEGQSKALPNYGSLLRVRGGIVRMRDAYIARAMSDPAQMGHTPQDAGYVHVTGGALLLDGTVWDRYTGQAETVPMVYNNGGYVLLRNSLVATDGGAWVGKPRYAAISGFTDSDATMTAI